MISGFAHSEDANRLWYFIMNCCFAYANEEFVLEPVCDINSRFVQNWFTPLLAKHEHKVINDLCMN